MRVLIFMLAVLAYLAPNGASAALTAGTASLTAATDTTLSFAVGAASGGAPAYTYQWYCATTSNFTPGGGNLIAGATGLTLAYVPPSAGPWFCVNIATDSTSATANSNQTAGFIQQPTVSIIFIGDSITAGFGLSSPSTQSPPAQLANTLISLGDVRTIVYTNQGVSGATTNDWQPGSANLNTALSAGAALVPPATYAMIQLGTNDSFFGVSQSTFATRMTNIANTLVSAGYKVILNDVPYSFASSRPPAAIALMQQYNTALATLANGSNILTGSDNVFEITMNNPPFFQADGLHPNALGAQAIGAAWSAAISKYILPSCLIPGGGRRSLFHASDDDGPDVPQVPLVLTWR